MPNTLTPKKINILLLLCACSILLIFILFWEKYDAARNNQAIQDNAKVIAHSVWDLDTAGSEAFLTLMVRHQNLRRITIYTHSNEVFINIDGSAQTTPEKILTTLKLAPEVTLESNIHFKGEIIGKIESIRYSDNIYLYFYILILLLLLAWVVQLYILNLEARKFLEIRVLERTADLSQTQKALAEEKERLTVTLRSIGDGVITTDMEGNIVLINTIAEELTGWKNEEAIGRPLTEVFQIIHEESKERCKNPVSKVMETGKIISLANHTALIAKDGSERSIADSGAPIKDGKNKIIGVVLVFRDVSIEIQREKELANVEKLESVGVLAGGIAHDFNNILGAILGNIDLALRFTREEDEAHNLMQQAKKATHRASNLTQQLLTFAKGGEPVKELAKIQETIEESADFVLRGSKVCCAYQWDDDLWPVEIDPGQISQVVQNLIINANQAMPDGGIIDVKASNLTCEKSLQLNLPPTKHIKISISDTGRGMNQQVLDKIFDPYFTTKQTGSGLGLAVSHSIISKHDGFMVVNSTLNAGTTFSIYLPAESEKTPVHADKKVVHSTHTVQARIMIMDDEEMVREIAGQMLQHLGYDIVFAANGNEAVALFTESMATDKSIDLIIMDLTIPGGQGGQETVKAIHKIAPDTKVVVASGYSNDPVMANYQDYGFLAAISKPFHLQDLEELIATVL